MQYPKRSQYAKDWMIGDSLWDLRFCNKVPGYDDKTPVVGLCDPSLQTIFIKNGQTPEERLKTFFHEVFHCIEDEYLGERMLHDHIYKFEVGAAEFFVDNWYEIAALMFPRG